MIRGFQIFFLESLRKFKFGVDPYDFMGYLQHYFPYKFDPADPLEGFDAHFISLQTQKLVDGNGKKIWITAKGSTVVNDFNKKFGSYDIVGFYEQCLANYNPTADISLIHDSQTQKTLEEIFQNCSYPVILDYGCGKMRLLNALFHDYLDTEWYYIGVDTEVPSALHPLEYMKLRSLKRDEQWEICTIDESRRFKGCADIVVLMNVVHELSIIDMASAFEDTRQILSDNGSLIIVDTVLIRKGEPDFVPLFPWEVKKIFTGCTDQSYISKSGVPIAFHTMQKDDIPHFHDLPSTLYRLAVSKRSLLLKVKNDLRNGKDIKLLKQLGIGVNKIFDYGYINEIIANVNMRIEEYDSYRITDNVDQLGFDILSWYLDAFRTASRLPSPAQIYSKLSLKYNYVAIMYVLHILTSIPSIFFEHGYNESMAATELYDIIVDDIGIDRIIEDGFKAVISEATVLHDERYR